MSTTTLAGLPVFVVVNGTVVTGHTLVEANYHFATCETGGVLVSFPTADVFFSEERAVAAAEALKSVSPPPSTPSDISPLLDGVESLLEAVAVMDGVQEVFESPQEPQL